MLEYNLYMETTKQDSKTPPKLRNPDGKGGFGDNPQNRHNGSWKKTETFRYWFDVFKEMTVAELKTWQNDNPEDKRSVASNLAFTRVIKAQGDLKEFQEVANRSEGMPKQTVEAINLNEKYEEYLEMCKQYGLDPATGLRLDN